MQSTRSTKWFLATAVAAAAGWASAGPARAAVTFVPTDDNNVLKSAATTVQTNGTSFQLKESSTAQSNARIGFLKFDLSAVPSIADPVTFTATTTTAVSGADFTLRLYALNAGAAGYDWTESAITYANRPAAGTTGTLVDGSQATAVGSTVTLANGAVSGSQAAFTFPGVDAYRQADGTVTLIFLVSSQTNGSPSLTFASSENATTSIVPTLTVVPEPTTAAAGLLLGAPALLLRRRRRRA